MKKFKFLGILFISLILVGCSSSEESAGKKISFSTWASEGEAAYAGMEEFKKIVEDETDYTVDIFPANQLGSTAEQMEQLKMGSIEIMASGDPGMMEIEMLSLPYLMPDDESWAKVLDSEIGEEWEEKMKTEQDIVNIGILPRGPRVISSNIEITSVDDLKGLKIRAPERDYYVETFKALGASPTPIDFGELYSALDTGIVSAQENPLETIVSGGFMEIQNNISLTNHMYKPAFIAINNTFLEGLSEEEREAFFKAATEAEKVGKSELEQEEQEMIEDLKNKGVVFSEPNIDEFKESTQVVRDELGIKTWGEDTYNEILEIVGGN